MSATRILWGQIVIALVVLLAVWGATQWTAWRLGFVPQLGEPWFYIWPGMPVYLPPAFFWWLIVYDAYAPRIFLQGACIAASGGLLAAAAAFALSIWRARDRAVETYGSARWAKPSEVRRAGLLGPDGVVLGRYRGAYLRHDGPEHVLCFVEDVAVQRPQVVGEAAEERRQRLVVGERVGPHRVAADGRISIVGIPENSGNASRKLSDHAPSADEPMAARPGQGEAGCPLRG